MSLQQQQSPRDRDERTTVVAHDPRGHDTRARDLPNPNANATVRSALRPDRGLDAAPRHEAPAPEILRVVETRRVTLRAPDGHAMPALLRAGKPVSSAHYDFAALRSQGVKLASMSQEIVPVQAQGGGVALGSIAAELEKLGLRVVPAEAAQAAPAEPGEVEQLKAQLAEMQKALAELTAAKKRG